MKRDEVYVRHMLEAVALIEQFTVPGREAFFAEPMRHSAVIRQFEILGEAAKNVSAELRERHPAVAWSGVTGMRDVLIHAYMRVDLKIVWDVAQERLPHLKLELNEILVELTSPKPPLP